MAWTRGKGRGPQKRLEKRDGGEGGGPAIKASEGELGGAVHSHEEVGLALLDPHLGNVYAEVADLVVLESSPALSSGARQPRDTVAFEAAVQRGAGVISPTPLAWARAMTACILDLFPASPQPACSLPSTMGSLKYHGSN